jgi:outer membrane receptor protein involved in Fe transport
VLRNRLGTAALVLLALAPVAAHAADDDPAPQEPPSQQKRFEETVEVVAPGTASVPALAELPLRPMAVMAVAGSADNVFRTLQALPGVAATTEFDSRLSVRGGSPDENLTIMDGVEIHNPYRLFGLASAFNPETVKAFDLYTGAFSAKYGDRLSSLLVVENRPGSAASRLRGSTALSLTDANAVLEGRLPGEATGSWIVTARRTYYDLVANSLVDTELPAFGDLQGRLDWNLGRETRLTFFGLLSREATDAFFEDDRPGEQLTLATTARNDLGALELTTRLGSSLQSRTIASFYLNSDEIDAAAQLRNEARRSNAPSDDVGFGLADVDFTRELQVRDLALRQELALAAGSHLVESGFEVHQLRTETLWRIEGDRNPTADNGSSIQGGAGLPSDLDSAVDSTRVGAWLVDRWQASPRVSLEAGLRYDWSGVNRRSTLSPRLAATWRLGPATRLRAGGGLFTQSPGYEKLIQSDYFVDLSGDFGRSLEHERAVHAVLGVERDLTLGLSARVEAYWKDLDDLVIGRLETEAERLARVAQYDFPAELVSSIPSSPIITSFPVNGAAGQSWGFDVLVQKRPTPGARLTGWASYTWGRTSRDEYGRSVPFDYDRPHAGSLVASWRFSPKWEAAATARAFSGFPRTPVLGLRVAAQETADGRLVPALDAEGRYVYETDSGDVANLNTARLPAFFRLDLRLSWKPRGDAGRWLFYLDVINATNRQNAGQIEPRLDYDPTPALDQPRLLLEPSAAIPFLPSVGVRFRF